MSTLKFPFLPGVKAAVCHKALTRVTDLTEAGTKVFNWVSAKGAEPGQPSRDDGKRFVTLWRRQHGEQSSAPSRSRRRVVICTNSRQRAIGG